MTEMLPVNRTKDQARRYYDRISCIYDWLTKSEKKFIKEGVDRLSTSPGETVLEIGPGTGTGLKLIAEALSAQGCVVGVDLSYEMLTESKEATRKSNPAPFLVQGDGVNLPLQGNQFDAVFCSFTLELFSQDEIGTVLKEIKRLMKPSGRLSVVALAQNPRTLPVCAYELIHQLFPVAVDCRPIPLIDLLSSHDLNILETEKLMNWGLPVHIVLCRKS